MQASCKLVLSSQFRRGINRCIATTAPDYLNIHTDGAVEKTVAFRKEQYAKLYKKGEALAPDVTEKSIQLQIPTTTHDASILTGVPEEHVVSRRVRIYRPTKNAMQSGAQNSKLWKIEFDTRERWENPTMGWTSNADPLSNVGVAMSFKTKEDAIAFTERQGWTCFVDEAREKKMQPKSYAINFAWNKRTRRAMK